MNIDTLTFAVSLKVFEKTHTITLEADASGLAWIDETGHVSEIALNVIRSLGGEIKYYVPAGDFFDRIAHTIESDYTDEIAEMLAKRERPRPVINISEYL